MAWLYLVAAYVGPQVGWDNLFLLLPHELGVFVAGAFMPLAFLWLVLLVIAGRARVSDAADVIADHYVELFENLLA